MVLDETGKSQWGWKQNSMITIHSKTGEVTRNMEYYLMKHFSGFVAPKAVKLNTSDQTTDLLAFVNTDGTLAIVAGNQEESEKELSVKVFNDAYTMKLAPGRFNTFRIKLSGKNSE